MYQFKYDISLKNQFRDKNTRGNITTLKKKLHILIKLSFLYVDEIILF